MTGHTEQSAPGRARLPRLLSIGEVAQRAGLAESTVRVYRSRGEMPAPDAMIGRTPGWLESTADAWIAALPGQGARTDLTRARTEV